MRKCKECGKEITRGSKSGLCGSCSHKGKIGEENSFYGKHHTEKTRDKLSAINRGEKHPMYGKHHSAETRAKLSAARRKQSGKNNPMFGKHHTTEARAKISDATIKYMTENPQRFISESEKYFFDLLEAKYGVTINRQFHLDGKVFDGQYNSHLIESDGTYWHSSDDAWTNDMWKSIVADKHNFGLHRFSIDSKEDADRVIEQYSEVLDKIFRE